MIDLSSSTVNKVKQKQSSHNNNGKIGLNSSTFHCYDMWIIYKKISILDEYNVVSSDR